VPQRPHLFASSLANNIALGRPDAPYEAIAHAAQAAALPHALDLVVENEATACPVANGSESPWPEPSCETRNSCYWTNRPRAWTPTTKRSSSPPHSA